MSRNTTADVSRKILKMPVAVLIQKKDISEGPEGIAISEGHKNISVGLNGHRRR